MFLAIKGLTFEGNAIIFAVITSFTGVALYFSYLNASTQKKAAYVAAPRARGAARLSALTCIPSPTALCWTH